VLIRLRRHEQKQSVSASSDESVGCFPFRFATDAEVAKFNLYLETGKEPEDLDGSYPEHLKSREEQIQILTGIYPCLNASGCGSFGNHLDSVMEGALAVPKIGDCSTIEEFCTAYLGVAKQAYAVLKERNPGKRFMADAELDGLKLVKKTAGKLFELNRMSDGVFFSFPVQIGNKYRGIPFRDLYWPEIKMDNNEFGLGPYEAIIFLLTHPEHLEKYDNLVVQCSGALVDKKYPAPEVPHRAEFRMLGSFFFWKIRKKLWVGLNDITQAWPNFGLATGFVV
jgi:hypothetical protein